MEEEEDKANIQRHVVIERRNRKVGGSGETAGKRRERREREGEREERERDARYGTPPFLQKKRCFFSRWHISYFTLYLESVQCFEFSSNNVLLGKSTSLKWLGSFKKPNICFWGTRLSVFISKSRSGPTIHSYESKRNRGLNVIQLLCTICVSIELEIKLKEIERRRKKTTPIICDSNLFAWAFEKRKKEWKRWSFLSFLWWRCSLSRVQNPYRWR